jgi:hypothetical protein
MGGTQLIVASSDHPDAESVQLRELLCANLKDLQFSVPVEVQHKRANPFILHKTLSSSIPSLFSTCTARRAVTGDTQLRCPGASFTVCRQWLALAELQTLPCPVQRALPYLA